MDETYSSKTSTSLPPPAVPQAEQGVLDLGALAGDAVQVQVPGYPERNVGDRLTLNWRLGGGDVVRRYAYLADPTRDAPDRQYEVRVQPLWALQPGDYQVDYTVTSRTGNVSQSAPVPITVVGTPKVPTVLMGGVIQTTLFGVYRAGVVGTWIAPGPYTIATERDVLVRSLASFSRQGASSPNVTLRFYRNDDGEPFASIVSDALGTTWTVGVPRSTGVLRGDLISIELAGEEDASLFLALAV